VPADGAQLFLEECAPFLFGQRIGGSDRLPWSIIGMPTVLSGRPYLGSDEQVQFQPTLTNGHRQVVQYAERRNHVFLGMNAGNFVDRTVNALPLSADFIGPCA
jgi:hypothetical protein